MTRCMGSSAFNQGYCQVVMLEVGRNQGWEGPLMGCSEG